MLDEVVEKASLGAVLIVVGARRTIRPAFYNSTYNVARRSCGARRRRPRDRWPRNQSATRRTGDARASRCSARGRRASTALDLRAAAERETIEAFVIAEVPEYRLDGSENRSAYCARPSGESIRSFICAVWVGGAAGSRPWKNATCRTGVVAGVRKHCARWAQGTQSRFAP